MHWWIAVIQSLLADSIARQTPSGRCHWFQRLTLRGVDSEATVKGGSTVAQPSIDPYGSISSDDACTQLTALPALSRARNAVVPSQEET